MNDGTERIKDMLKNSKRNTKIVSEQKKNEIGIGCYSQNGNGEWVADGNRCRDCKYFDKDSWWCKSNKITGYPDMNGCDKFKEKEMK
jgi:hypothetical protein